MTSTATATLVSSLALSRIYYCHSLLFGSTHDVTSHLQRIQNYAARVTLRLPMSSNITIIISKVLFLHLVPYKWIFHEHIYQENTEKCSAFHLDISLLFHVMRYCLVYVE